ncbi:MAG: sulfite exporter TauE/SafE family protein [Dehalococcoidia bacterium]
MELSDLLLIPLGMAVGAFGTLVGAGGGFILVPVLLLLYPDEDPKTLTATSLLVVLLNAVSGSIAYGRQKRIDYHSGKWFALATLPGAVGGAIVVGYIPRRQFDALFATIVIVVALFLLLRSQRTGIVDPVQGRWVVHRRIVDANGSTFVYSFRMAQGLALSAGIGFMSSLLGIGGGIIHVPAMAMLLHFPVHIAVATSQFVLGVMAGQGVITHVVTHTIQWDAWLARGMLLSLGAIPGAQLGARLGRRAQGTVILRALAGALLLVGIRLGLKAL